MEKCLTVLLTDTHFGTHNNSMTWFKSQKDFIENQFIPHLQQRKDEGYKVRVIHCGDVFDSRSTINSYIASEVVELFSRICEIIDKFVIVLGNHDYYNPSSDNVDTVSLVFGQLILRYKHFMITPKQKTYDIWGSEQSLFVPWYEWLDQKGLIKYLKSNTIDNIFTHADLDREETKITKPIIFNGHVHTPFFKKNIKNLGSCFSLTFADCNQDRGFYEYEDGGELRFIKNEKSIRFWRFYNKEVLKIPRGVSQNDYIELYVEKSLLMNPTYSDACNRWTSKFKNIWVIPQVDEGDGKVVDLQKFEGYDIEKMTERLIPDEIKDKFERIKQYINNTNKDI